MGVSVKIDMQIFFFFYFIFRLHNCISFAKYQNESATGITVIGTFYVSRRWL